MGQHGMHDHLVRQACVQHVSFSTGSHGHDALRVWHDSCYLQQMEERFLITMDNIFLWQQARSAYSWDVVSFTDQESVAHCRQ